MSPGKKFVYTAILLLVAAGLLEVLSYGILSFEAWRRPYKFRHDTAYYLERIPDGWEAAFYERAYHPVLGWDGARYGVKPGQKRGDKKQGKKKADLRGYDDKGARVDPDHAGSPAVIAAFGDSFTKGAEVKWNESWPYYLSELLDGYVANYGVGGYGPDQATLKFRASPLTESKPRFAILGIFEENINRVVNRFRPYYEEDGLSFLVFKPRFAIGPQGPELLASPLAAPTTDRQALAAMIEEARDGDLFWARKVEPGFPYSYSLSKIGLHALGKVTGKALPLGIYTGNLWGVEEPTATMNAVIDAFIAEADARGIEPVILFIPRIRRSILDDPAGWAPNYAGFPQALAERYGERGLIVLDAAEASFDPEKMHVQPFAGHYSPYGNKVVARFIYDRLIARVTE
jgi:hypothetical protein